MRVRVEAASRFGSVPCARSGVPISSVHAPMTRCPAEPRDSDSTRTRSTCQVTSPPMSRLRQPRTRTAWPGIPGPLGRPGIRSRRSGGFMRGGEVVRRLSWDRRVLTDAGVSTASEVPLPGSAGVSPALPCGVSGGGPLVRACGRDARAPRDPTKRRAADHSSSSCRRSHEEGATGARDSWRSPRRGAAAGSAR